MSSKQSSVTSQVKHALAFRLMHIIVVCVPLLAGIDKYFNFITDWEQYISPALKPIIPLSPKQIMRCAGAVEASVGATAIYKPRLGAIALALLLCGIIGNLLTMKKQLHIVSLDLCLSCFALVFALLLPEAENKK